MGWKLTGVSRNTRKVYEDLPGDLPGPVIYRVFRETGSRYQKLEEKRFMREQEYRAAQRREERQHELTMMQMLLAATQNTAVNTIPTAFQCFNCPIVPDPNAENMHYMGAGTYTNRDDDNDYFKL